MDLKKPFSDAWRVTFGNGAQWPFVAAVVGLLLAVGGVIGGIQVALLWRAFSAVGIDLLAPSQPWEAPQTFGPYVGQFVGSLFVLIVLGFVFAVLLTYLLSLLEAGLVYSGGAILAGQRPAFSETWRNARHLSLRVWGIRILAFHIPTYVLYMVVYILTYALGFGFVAAGEESGASPEFAGTLCCGAALALLGYAVGWAFFYSWSQLAVRHGVLWRQNAFASLGQGFEVLRARLGAVLLVLLMLLGVSVVGFGTYFAVIAVLAGVMPTDEAQICGMLVALLGLSIGLLATQVFFSNLWTALVLHTRPGQPGLPAEEGPPSPPGGGAPAGEPSMPSPDTQPWSSPLPPPPSHGGPLPPPPPPATPSSGV